MYKKFAVAGMLMVSVSAFASTSTVVKVNTSKISGEAVASESAAIDQARELLTEINGMSSLELNNSLNSGAAGQVNVNSFKVVNSSATVDEIITTAGIAYQPTINVSYQYQAIVRD
ncbi:DUF3316 domain-containing protein [Vibrio sp.]|uniref:DUF3316 domain-containing protein n=1 Tax=Vibrio sp. TaxID=678 RepID=UPI003D0EBB76